MYRLFLLLLFLIISISTNISAQSVLTPTLPDTLLNSETKEHDQLTYLKNTETRVTAIVLDYYDSGQLKMKRSVVNGKAEGVWIEWYETGFPRFIAEWRQGKGDGLWIYFHENGQLRSREQVKQDVWHGISESWYANGQKKSEGQHHQGQKHGPWNYWNLDGSHQQTELYTNGSVTRTITTNAN